MSQEEKNCVNIWELDSNNSHVEGDSSDEDSQD